MDLLDAWMGKLLVPRRFCVFWGIGGSTVVSFVPWHSNLVQSLANINVTANGYIASDPWPGQKFLGGYRGVRKASMRTKEQRTDVMGGSCGRRDSFMMRKRQNFFTPRWDGRFVQLKRPRCVARRICFLSCSFRGVDVSSLYLSVVGLHSWIMIVWSQLFPGIQGFLYNGRAQTGRNKTKKSLLYRPLRSLTHLKSWQFILMIVIFSPSYSGFSELHFISRIRHAVGWEQGPMIFSNRQRWWVGSKWILERLKASIWSSIRSSWPGTHFLRSSVSRCAGMEKCFVNRLYTLYSFKKSAVLFS